MTTERHRDAETGQFVTPTIAEQHPERTVTETAHQVSLAAHQALVSLSLWIDAGNAGRDPEAITWGRLAKISEEHGEVIAAYIGATGQNPRKGVTHTLDDVAQELLDVAVTALCAYEHITGHKGLALAGLSSKILTVAARAESAPRAAIPADFVTRWDDLHLFPFIEDEDANITGYGHQDRKQFAEAVNHFDEICNGSALDVEPWTADNIAHRWAALNPADDERLILADGPGAIPGTFPITTLWGQR
ncbi:MazG-like family protein [Actinotalea sp. JY-7876]|uniref:MazG-like family protein n=1 Tax=Actinotalea sp. JY-7876 TaxID=2758442 RepID=UPI001C716919|nr:MazG-like family protein [Actinotalea sp. JY-7876]